MNEPPGFSKALAIIDNKIAEQAGIVKYLQRRCDMIQLIAGEPHSPSASQDAEAAYNEMLVSQNLLARLQLFREWAVLNPDKIIFALSDMV